MLGYSLQHHAEGCRHNKVKSMDGTQATAAHLYAGYRERQSWLGQLLQIDRFGLGYRKLRNSAGRENGAYGSGTGAFTARDPFAMQGRALLLVRRG